MFHFPRYFAARRRTCEILEQARPDDFISRCADLVLMALILLSVVAIILESMESLRYRYGSFLSVTEDLVVVIFSAEYLLRMWSAADSAQLNADGGGAWRARLRYLTSPMAIIDLIAILPTYLVLFGVFGGTSNMLVLRTVRLLRILKLTRYSASFALLSCVFKENIRGLGAAFFLLIVVMLIAASGIYVFEHQAQPEAFGSIPAAMWWAFATLTTVGYGDVTPITVGGRVFGASITVVGVGMVALPTAILASAFSEQLRVRTRTYSNKVDKAIEDGVVTTEESRELESLRKELGLGRESAEQILTLERARLMNRFAELGGSCPHCSRSLVDPPAPKHGADSLARRRSTSTA